MVCVRVSWFGFRSQEADLIAKWDASSWAKKRARKVKRATMTDFDRFKVCLCLVCAHVCMINVFAQ